MPVEPALLDRFIPRPDVSGRHQITIHAPPALVMETARNFQIESIWAVHTLFRLRAALLGAGGQPPRSNLGFIAQMQSLGWQCLAEDPSRYYVAGCACEPWLAEPVFSPLAPESFASFADPGRVKIAWTLEATPLAPTLTRFATETRVVASDDEARFKFRRYWRKFGAGIVLIRLVLLPAIRKEAERRWRRQRMN